MSEKQKDNFFWKELTEEQKNGICWMSEYICQTILYLRRTDMKIRK